MADRPVLVCIEGSLQGRVFPVLDGGMEIGRSPENDLVVDDDGVSRFHARLLYDNGSLWLRDAGSRNGIWVNDQKLADHKALKVGDTVRIGEHAALGAGVVARPGVTIGPKAVIGAGAVLTRDVPEGETWAGNPARSLTSAPGRG